MIEEHTELIVIIAIIFSLCLFGFFLILSQPFTSDLERTAIKNCPNGYKINELCMHEIYGYECTNTNKTEVFYC